jgi:amino acid adenylation domain-containing protein
MTRDEILDDLLTLMSEILPNVSPKEMINMPFLEIGANSLILMEMMRTISSRYNVSLVIKQFFEELTTLDALATYLERNQFKDVIDDKKLSQTESPEIFQIPDMTDIDYISDLANDASEIEIIFSQQLQAAKNAVSEVVQQQLDFLKKQGLTSHLNDKSQPVQKMIKSPVSDENRSKAPQSAVSPQVMLSPLEIRARGLTKKQQHHLESLIKRYTERTKTSKKLAQRYRPVLADSRASVGFRFTTKEMLYPIIGKRAKGARIWDVDDNEYIDITMGQGVTLFGHHAPFIEEALASEPKDVIQLGPRDPNVGEAAKIITELTGMDRVTFTNSGTEAVMAALRLARAVTGKSKIVMFENSYHGHSDGTLGRPDWQDDNLFTEPAAPGIPIEAVHNILVLEYDTEKALDYIRSHTTELAAVIVEPVQSRRPDLQPKTFLQQLRKITQEHNIVLIFDEMITGFRLHPGGAQAFFGVKADLATYGKVIGGGMPIGVIAGKSEIMDQIDGGMWAYGDASYPEVERVAFGGTFCQHPLTMTTTLATLKYLKKHSPDLQERLNKMTKRLAETLNAFFVENEVPIEIVYCGSQFRFAFSTNLELLFYHLMEKGVFIWEWRNYFLSTAHTDNDVDDIINAVKESIQEMRDGDFLPALSKKKNISISANESIIPLTEAQKQLYALSIISEKGSTSYNICNVIQLTGHLDISAIQKAIHTVIERHESLRTIIKNKTQQEILTNVKIDIPLIDFSHPDHKDQELKEWIKEKNTTQFNLSQGPLFQPYMIKLDTNQHLMVLTAHHIIIDGISINIILQDIAAIYSSIVNNQEISFDPSTQYREYVQWRCNELNTINEKYWLEKLSGELPVLDLPTDRQHPPLKTYQGQRMTFFLDDHACKNLEKLSKSNGCTPFMMFFSIYALWLHRLAQQDDIIVGIPVTGRPEDNRSHSLVGYGTHLLPMRSCIQWDQSFLDYLKYIRGNFLDALHHQDYPFANLINQLKLNRDGSQSLIVSTVFNLDRPGNVPVFHDLRSEWMPQPIFYTAFDMTFNLTEIENKYVLDCDFNTDIYDPSTIQQFVGHYQTLINQILKNPDNNVSKLSLLNETQLKQLIVDFNDTQTEYPKDKCIHHLFESQVEKCPNDIAVVYKDQQLTYHELNQKASQLAHFLIDLNVTAETIVGICVERSLEMIIGIIGILKSGGAYLPLDPSYPKARLTFMLDDANAPILLTQKNIMEQLNIDSQLNSKIIYLDHDWNDISTAKDTNPESNVNPDHLAYIIYTSGSTGKPKGTMIIHQGLMNYLSWACNEYNVAQGPGTPVNSSISFDATITSLFTPLMVGKRVELLPENIPEIESLHQALSSKTNWSLVKITPAHLDLLNTLLPQDQFKKQSRAFILGGEALYSKTVSLWTQKAPETRLINEYGPTETVVGCCVYEIDPEISTSGAVPIGKPIANTQLYILDERLQPLPIGVPGELYIGGDGVARGYINREKLTAEKFIASPFSDNRLYKTGDLARFRDDGIIEYLGRMDNQVKIRGFRVEPGEVESLLTNFSEITESVVTVHELSAQDLRLIAYFVADKKVQSGDIRHYLSDHIPSFMIPAAFVQMDSMPLTTNGKIDRKALPIPEDMRTQSTVDYVSPKTETQSIIADIWKKVLRVSKVGIYDNFFESGGHSLLIPEVYDLLLKKFDRKDFTAIDLFKYPTINALANFLSQQAGHDITKKLSIKQIAKRQKQAFQRRKKIIKKRD